MEFARGTTNGRTMTDDASRFVRARIHSFIHFMRLAMIHAFMHSRRARAVCVRISIDANARVSCVVFFHVVRAHRSVERDVARVEGSSSQRRASFHSFIHSFE